MANYLERVASSAGRRATSAKPPVSGPPVLPAGRDFSIAPADPFAMDEEQFVESSETHTPLRRQDIEVPSVPKTETASELKATAPHETLAAPVEPRPRPRPVHERLSSESAFKVQVPRTLRPITADIQPPSATERPGERPRVHASTPIGSEEFTVAEEPAPDDLVAAEADTPRPKTPVADRKEEYQAPRPVTAEAARSETTPIPRVDRADGPPRLSVQAAEPSPPSATPVHLPPAISTTRQEQSRIHIGSLEVLVNNHPRIPTARPAPAPSRTERLNLEKRYLDRFRLRH